MNPIELFLEDQQRAAGLNDPMAERCMLSTCDEGGRPRVRTLVLRIVKQRPALFLNASSPKWRQLNRSGASSETVVFWPTLNLQYRLSGAFDAMPRALLRQHWQMRPRPSKLLDRFYRESAPQSTEFLQRQAFLTRFQQVSQGAEEELQPDDLARGIWLRPRQVERLDLAVEGEPHDRQLWRLTGETWRQTALVP